MENNILYCNRIMRKSLTTSLFSCPLSPAEATVDRREETGERRQRRQERGETGDRREETGETGERREETGETGDRREDGFAFNRKSLAMQIVLTEIK